MGLRLLGGSHGTPVSSTVSSESSRLMRVRGCPHPAPISRSSWFGLKVFAEFVTLAATASRRVGYDRVAPVYSRENDGRSGKISGGPMTLLWHEIRKNPLLWLLVFVPAVLAAEHVFHAHGTVLFILAVLAI